MREFFNSASQEVTNIPCLLLHAETSKSGEEEKENHHQSEEKSEQVKAVPNAVTEKNVANPKAKSPSWSSHCLRTLTTAVPSVEDSPVKSLRKWVDGCFYQPPLVEPDTPPSTPPHRTTAETPVITSGEWHRV